MGCNLRYDIVALGGEVARDLNRQAEEEDVLSSMAKGNN